MILLLLYLLEVGFQLVANIIIQRIPLPEHCGVVGRRMFQQRIEYSFSEVCWHINFSEVVAHQRLFRIQE